MSMFTKFWLRFFSCSCFLLKFRKIDLPLVNFEEFI